MNSLWAVLGVFSKAKDTARDHPPNIIRRL
jgi:hypothetical protein